MNVELSRRSSGLEYIPNSNGLDEFDAETDALVPRQVLASRVDLDRGDVRLTAGSTSLFAMVDAGPELYRPQVPSPVAPRLASLLLLAALSSGILLIGTGTLPSPYANTPSVPSALEARHVADADTLALSPAPDIAADVAAAAARDEHNIPVVYQRPYTAPDPPVVAAIDGSMDIETVRRAFEGLRDQNLEFRHCDVRLASADHAVARCRGTLGDLSKWTMDLNRTGEQWRVVSVEASTPSP